MIDAAELLAQPGVESLIRVLEYERRLLERLLYRQAEVSMLVSASQARFLAMALDELESVAVELGSAEMVRECLVATLATQSGVGLDDLTLERLVDLSPDRLVPLLHDLRVLWAEIESVRSLGYEQAGLQAGRIRAGLTAISDEGYASRFSRSAEAVVRSTFAERSVDAAAAWFSADTC